MYKIGYDLGESRLNNVSSFLSAVSQITPNKPIFKWRNLEGKLEHISYRAFEDRAARIAAGLLSYGITRGDRMIVFIAMNADLYLMVSALQRLGAVPVFLDSWTRQIHLSQAILQAKPTAIISVEKVFHMLSQASMLPPLKIAYGFERDDMVNFHTLTQTPKQLPIAAVNQEDTALITFTTGSSGEPKGANRTHRFLAAQHYALEEAIPYQADDIDLPLFPVFALNNVAAGISTVLTTANESGDTSPEALVTLMQEGQVTTATLTLSVLKALTRYCRDHATPLPNLHRVITGGAPVGMAVVNAFKTQFPKTELIILYGSTEVEPICQVAYTKPSLLPEEVMDAAHEGVLLGTVAHGLDYRLIRLSFEPITIRTAHDWSSLLTPPGEPGELIVAGEHVCPGYIANQTAFDRAKIQDLDGRVWHRTGDVVRIDDDNQLWMLGRVHTAFPRKGKILFPVTAEQLLHHLPGVVQAAYLGIPNRTHDYDAVAVLQLDASRKHDTVIKTLKERAAGLFERHHLPLDHLIITEKIPMDPRHQSKVEYSLLKKQLHEHALI
jgi:olefin beta-lactone synthetase